MDKLSKSLEVLKSLSTSTSESLTTSNEKYKFNYILLTFYLSFSSFYRSRLDPISISKEKIHHLNTITDLLCSPILIK